MMSDPISYLDLLSAVAAPVCASVVAAIAAVCAPVITARINQRGNRTLRAMELLYNSRLDAYSEFLSSSAAFLHSRSIQTLSRFQDSINASFLVASSSTYALLAQCSAMISSLDYLHCSSDELKRLTEIQHALTISMQADLRQYHPEKKYKARKKH